MILLIAEQTLELEHVHLHCPDCTTRVTDFAEGDARCHACNGSWELHDLLLTLNELDFACLNPPSD